MGEYNLAEARMLVIWLGALCVLSGLLFIATQPIWRGRLSEARRRKSSAVPRDAAMKPVEPMTLEPRRPGAGFGLKANWPGLLLITYRARWHSLAGVGWPVAAIVVFRIEALPDRLAETADELAKSPPQSK